MLDCSEPSQLEDDTGTVDKGNRRKIGVVEDKDIFENAPSDCSMIGDLLIDNEDVNKNQRRSEASADSGSEGSQGSQPVSASKLTVNTNPEWCKILKNNFHGLIVNRCCLRTRDAVENNEAIEVCETAII